VNAYVLFADVCCLCVLFVFVDWCLIAIECCLFNCVLCC